MALSRPVSNQQISLFLALEQAGIELSVDEFDQRLILQKAVCLLQSAKVHFGYNYRWYLRGPYCPALAEDLFYLADLPAEDKEELRTWALGQQAKDRIVQIKQLFTATNTQALAAQLELLGSLAFLFQTNQAHPNDVERTTSVLKHAGKLYDSNQVARAVETLRTHGLVA